MFCDFLAYQSAETAEPAQVGIECPGECDQEKLNIWIATLLRERGVDIFRTKGVLAVPWRVDVLGELEQLI